MNIRTQTRIGISGWTYAPWRGIFYPKGVSQKRELEYAGAMVNSIEINGSFYSLQRPSSYQAWYDATPDNFIFSLKGGRYITHMRRLKDVEAPLANFFCLGRPGPEGKARPDSLAIAAEFSVRRRQIRAIFELLPRDSKSAAKFAEGHDQMVSGRALTRTDANRPLRYALEVRHASFENAQFIDLLRRHNVALVIADTAGKWPYTEDITADFIYARLHGDEELYASGYTPAALDRWAAALQAWQQGKEPADARHWSKKKPPKAKMRDVFVYFDNDVKVKAPFDAMSLADRMGNDARGAGRSTDAASPPPEIAKRFSERVRSHWPGVKSEQRKKTKI